MCLERLHLESGQARCPKRFESISCSCPHHPFGYNPSCLFVPADASSVRVAMASVCDGYRQRSLLTFNRYFDWLACLVGLWQNGAVRCGQQQLHVVSFSLAGSSRSNLLA